MHLTDLTWPDVAALDKDTPILFPIAALEQHGRHMPVFTDSMLAGEIMRRVEAQMRDNILVAPMQWLGNSHHHLDFPGTLSAEPRLYIDLLNGLLENFIAHGFKRLIFFNGHGGNDIPGKQSVFETRQKYRDRKDLLLLFITYWNLDVKPWETLPALQQREMGHACEWETSMVLSLRPELVKDHATVPEVPFGNPFLPASRGWTMPDRSEPGHVGIPAAATAEKGEHLFQCYTAAAVRFIERVIDWDGASWEG